MAQAMKGVTTAMARMNAAGRQSCHSLCLMVADERLSLADLITHRRFALQAEDAYPIAFNDPRCLKMVLDWRAVA